MSLALLGVVSVLLFLGFVFSFFSYLQFYPAKENNVETTEKDGDSNTTPEFRSLWKLINYHATATREVYTRFSLPVLNNDSVKSAAPCDECGGRCCKTVETASGKKSGFYSLEMHTYEIDRWVNSFGTSRLLFRKDGSVSLRMRPQCIFLGANNECTIYSRRPSTCRNWSCCDDHGRPDWYVMCRMDAVKEFWDNRQDKSD